MPTLLEIKQNPSFINANAETKKAIFEKWAPQDPMYTKANQETQAAIRQKLGVEVEVPKPRADAIPAPREERSLVGQATDLYKRGMGAIGEFAQEAAGRQARSMVGGLAGAATIPEYLMSTVGLAEKGATERGLREMTGIPEGDFYFGAGKLGSEIAGTAGVGNVLAAPLRGAAVLSSPATAQALRTGAKALEQYGFGAKGLGLKAAGGAAPAFVTAGITGEDTTVPTTVGALLPFGGQFAGFVIKKGREFISPQNVTLLEATGNDIDALIDKLNKGEVLIPGARPHAGEVAAEVGNPDFSRLVASLLHENVRRTPAQNKEISEELVNAAVARARQFEAATGSAESANSALLKGLQTPGVTADDVFASITGGARQASAEESARVAAQGGQERAALLAQQEQEMRQAQNLRGQVKNALAQTQARGSQNLLAEQEAAKQQLLNQQMLERTSAQAARQERMNQLAIEQEQARNALAARPVQVAPSPALVEEQARLAALEEQRATVGSNLPDVSQMKVGAPIISAAEELAKEAQEKLVTPAYQAYFKSHKGTIDFSDTFNAAQNQGIDLGSLVYLQVNKNAQGTLNKIQKYKADLKNYQEEVQMGKKPKPPSLNLSLEDSSNIRAALNSEFDALKGSLDSNANAKAGQVNAVANIVDNQIQKNISAETAELGRIARETSRTKKKEPFDEGIVGLMRQETSMGRERLIAENIGKEVLSKEQSAAEFVRAFGPNSPLAGSEQALSATNSLKTSILDLYRREVAPKGTVDLAKHEDFLRKNRDKIAILDEGGIGIRDAIEEQRRMASGIEEEAGKVKERIAGLNKVQEEQLAKLQQEQKTAMENLKKTQEVEKGAEKERLGLEFKQLTDRQKATLGATEKEQRAAYAELTDKQKAKRGLISEKLAEKQRQLQGKQTLERKFLEDKQKAEARNVTRKYSKIMNYSSPEAMRRSFLKNPAELEQASRFLNEDTKRRLAHDVVADVVSGENILKSLKDNTTNLVRILESAHPGKGQEIMDSLIGKAQTLESFKRVAKEDVMRPTQPLRMESKDILERVDLRRSQFSKEQLSDIDALITDMKRVQTFRDLAKIGSTEGDRIATDVMEKNTGSSTFIPAQIDSVVTAINSATRRLERLGNRKIAEKLVMAALNPKMMAELLDAAKQWETKGKRIEKGIVEAGKAITRVQALPNRKSENRNALNQ